MVLVIELVGKIKNSVHKHYLVLYISTQYNVLVIYIAMYEWKYSILATAPTLNERFSNKITLLLSPHVLFVLIRIW